MYVGLENIMPTNHAERSISCSAWNTKFSFLFWGVCSHVFLSLAIVPAPSFSIVNTAVVVEASCRCLHVVPLCSLSLSHIFFRVVFHQHSCCRFSALAYPKPYSSIGYTKRINFPLYPFSSPRACVFRLPFLVAGFSLPFFGHPMLVYFIYPFR